MGCDLYVYIWQPYNINEWFKLSPMKAWYLSASTDSLWIVDEATRMPFKWDVEG